MAQRLSSLTALLDKPRFNCQHLHDGWPLEGLLLFCFFKTPVSSPRKSKALFLPLFGYCTHVLEKHLYTDFFLKEKTKQNHFSFL
jgi:hypothetical protein